MEADWEFEVADDAPVIDGAWAGLVDLRREPQRAAELPEAARIAGLAAALERLNDAASPVWTSKCDAWEPEEFDQDELDAGRDAAATAMACYIDLLARNSDTWATLDEIAGWCRRLCARLRERPLRSCRADLVIRRAVAGQGHLELGITAYLTACGATRLDAETGLGRALGAFADAVAR